jgi:hypothetical protein
VPQWSICQRFGGTYCLHFVKVPPPESVCRMVSAKVPDTFKIISLPKNVQMFCNVVLGQKTQKHRNVFLGTTPGNPAPID